MDPGEQADDRVEAVADEDGGLLVDARDADAPGGARAEDEDAVGPVRVPRVEVPPREQLGPHRAEGARATPP